MANTAYDAEPSVARGARELAYLKWCILGTGPVNFPVMRLTETQNIDAHLVLIDRLALELLKSRAPKKDLDILS
jgi:hypothetical protein